MRELPNRPSVSLLSFILVELKYVTLFRLLVSAFWFSSGFLLVILTGVKWDPLGFLVYACGVLAGVLVSWLFIYGRARTLPFPACRCGKCQVFDDYSWQEGTFYGCRGLGVYMYKCRCGDFYLRSGNSFMELLADGTAKPYKILGAGRKWVDADPNSSAPR